MADPTLIRRCRLRVGGRWKPLKEPDTTVTRTKVCKYDKCPKPEGCICPGNEVIDAFREVVGWKWGGDLPDRLKDFMHFSITGE